MPRKYVRKKPRTKLVKEAERLLFQILVYKRGERCEICGGPPKNLGLFHILPKGRYRHIRLHQENLLLAGWYCCHFPFHHDFYIARDRIVPKIKELRGADYEDELSLMDVASPSLTLVHLQEIVASLEKELKRLEKGWDNGELTPAPEKFLY